MGKSVDSVKEVMVLAATYYLGNDVVGMDLAKLLKEHHMRLVLHQ